MAAGSSTAGDLQKKSGWLFLYRKWMQGQFIGGGLHSNSSSWPVLYGSSRKKVHRSSEKRAKEPKGPSSHICQEGHIPEISCPKRGISRALEQIVDRCLQSLIVLDTKITATNQASKPCESVRKKHTTAGQPAMSSSGSFGEFIDLSFTRTL